MGALCWEGLEGEAGDGGYLDPDPRPDLAISFLVTLGKSLFPCGPQFLHLHDEGVGAFSVMRFL